MEDAYSKRIQLYKDCLEVLWFFTRPNEDKDKDEFITATPIKYVINTLVELDAIKEDAFVYRSTNNTIKYRENRYFENKIDELISAKNQEELLERSTKSAEESAIAAKNSVLAANKSADHAEKANKLSELSIKKSEKANNIAVWSIVISIIIAILQLLIGCESTIQFIKSFWREITTTYY